jgi:ABC-2 type transport system ATP-binding protein
MTAPVLSVTNLVKHFPRHSKGLFRRQIGEVHAVCDVSFSLLPGETLGLVGESGCGKTTTARMLLGLIPPTSGTAHVLGHDIATEGGAIRAAVGYLPEHDCLPPDVSASDFVVHLAMMSGLPRVAARERAA